MSRGDNSIDSTVDSCSQYNFQESLRIFRSLSGGSHQQHVISDDTVSSNASDSYGDSDCLVPHRFGKPTILPCRICGDAGDGLHYGVNTCRSCKVFYQRSSVRKGPLVCKLQNTCEIDRSNKSICAACRYQRCLQTGMSRKAIRTGRYSYEKKTRDIEELRQLELEARVSGRLGHALLSTKERENQLDAIIDHMTNIHLSQATCTQKFLREMPQKEKVYKEGQTLQENFFGKLAPIPRDEYREIYDQTGIDIDGRRAIYLQLISNFDAYMKRYSSFIVAIPGFKKLPVDDQLSLVKETLFVCDIMTSYHTYNQELHSYTSAEEDMTFGVHELETIYSPTLLAMYTSNCLKLQRLELTPEEDATLLCYVIVTSDVNLTLEGRRVILSLQETISDALVRLLERNHDNHNQVFSKVISIVLNLHLCASLTDAADREMEAQFPDLQWPEVTKAVLDVHSIDAEVNYNF